MAGKIFFDNRDIIPLNIEERAKLGISVGFQTPPEISGVKLANLLKACVGKTVGEPFDEEETRLIEAFKVTDLLNRDVNVGFSGGERKRCEILQTIFLKPKLLLLDEPDSGVDVESLALIGNEIQRYVENSGSSALIVTHQGQILDYVKANYACVLLNGLAYCFKDPKKIYENIRSVGYERCVMCTNRGIEERVC
jgi:Fe-S cluster assembly ATP-binding protein